MQLLDIILKSRKIRPTKSGIITLNDLCRVNTSSISVVHHNLLGVRHMGVVGLDKSPLVQVDHPQEAEEDHSRTDHHDVQHCERGRGAVVRDFLYVVGVLLHNFQAPRRCLVAEVLTVEEVVLRIVVGHKGVVVHHTAVAACSMVYHMVVDYSLMIHKRPVDYVFEPERHRAVVVEMGFHKLAVEYWKMSRKQVAEPESHNLVDSAYCQNKNSDYAH